MIVLDTNVVSELMSSQRNAAVVAWLNAQQAGTVWTTAISIFEIRHGLARLPAGRRLRTLTSEFDATLWSDLGGRILNLDSTAATEAALISAKASAMGRPIDIRDVMIAGIVAAQPNATLATRNIKHFADTGVPLVDPWSAAIP